jgi:hypothetical protein
MIRSEMLGTGRLPLSSAATVPTQADFSCTGYPSGTLAASHNFANG